MSIGNCRSVAGTFLIILCLTSSQGFSADRQPPAPTESGDEDNEQQIPNRGFSRWLPGKQQHVSAEVADPFIEFRTGPGRGYPIFYIAERGESVLLLKQRTSWVKVRNHKEIEGWVHVDQMARTLGTDRQPLAFQRNTLEDFRNRRWESGIMLGDFGGTDAITAYAGYQFTRNISAEIALSQTLGEFSDGQAATFSIVHQPFPRWRYSPFFTMGGGTRKTGPRSNLVQTQDRTDDSLHVGGGIRIYITRHFLLRLQYKRHTILTNRDDDEEVNEWKLGLSTFF